MPKPTNITAIVLCKNGALTLTHCLESLDFCENIIVGDDNSTDDSIVIAKHYHADVIKLPADINFSHKRNFLLEYVRTEWILFVDVDEVVTKELSQELLDGHWESKLVNGFFINRRDFFMGKRLYYGETSHTKLLRFARKDTGKWVRSVHETWNISGHTDTLVGEILHFPHPTLESFFEKINRYTQLEVIERSSKARRSTAYFQLFVFPLAKFVQNYIVRFGMLDGYPGLIMAWMMSFHSLCVRIKLLERLRTRS